jgi:hypothetical protein
LEHELHHAGESERRPERIVPTPQEGESLRSDVPGLSDPRGRHILLAGSVGQPLLRRLLLLGVFVPGRSTRFARLENPEGGLSDLSAPTVLPAGGVFDQVGQLVHGRSVVEPADGSTR